MGREARGDPADAGCECTSDERCELNSAIDPVASRGGGKSIPSNASTAVGVAAQM